MRALIPSLLMWFSVQVHADEQVVEMFRVDELRIERPGERLVFKVKIERLDRELIEQRGPEQRPEAWMKGKQLPTEILWHRPTLIREFSLEVDGKEIEIPAQFWNDLAGFDLMDGRLTPKEPTEEQWWEFRERLSHPRLRPQVARSAHGGTVLITWARPEE